MKQIFRFFSLLCAVMTSAVAMAGDWTVPAPQAVSPTFGGLYTEAATYYVRNVGTGKYLSWGEGWGTQSVVADKGLKYRVVNKNPNDDSQLAEGRYWLMSPDIQDAGKGNFTLCRWNDGSMVGDGIKCCFADQTNYSLTRAQWVFTHVGNNRYKLTIPEEFNADNADFNETEHWYYVEGEALGVNTEHASNAGTEGVTWGTYYDVNYDDFTANCQWEFVPVEAYEAYEAKLALVKKMNEAELLSIDLTNAIALLNSNDATVEDINAETANLQEELEKADQWNHPKDITSQYIVNPNPYSNIEGWTLGSEDQKVNAFDPDNQCAEFWNQAGFSIHQTIKNLPAGAYTLRVKAFTRTDMHAVLRIGSASMEIATVGSGSVNNRSGANTWFNADEANGLNVLEFINLTDGDVELSLTADNTTSDYWMVWRSFQLLDRGTSNVKGLIDLFKAETEGWEEEFVDKPYTMSYYEAVARDVADADNLATAADVFAAYGNLYALRENVELYLKLGKELAYYGDDSFFGYDPESHMFDEKYGDFSYIIEEVVSELVGTISAQEMTNEELQEAIERLAAAVKEALNEALNAPVDGQDMTEKVINAAFLADDGKTSSLKGWTIEGTGFENNAGTSGVVEQWSGNSQPADLHVWQKICLPPGAYRLSTSCFYRAGTDNADAYAKWVAANGQDTGDNKVRMSLYASSSMKPFHNIMEHIYPEATLTDTNTSESVELATYTYGSEAEGTLETLYSPNSVGHANFVFNHPNILDRNNNKADWSIYVDFISTGDSILIGIKGTQVGAHAWTIWDNVTLTRINNKLETLQPIALEAAENAKALLDKTMSAATKQALQDAITAIEGAETSHDLLTAYAALGDRIDAANASIDAYVRLQDALDELNAAIETYPDNQTAVNAATTLANQVATAIRNGSINDEDIDDKIAEMKQAIVNLQISDEPASRTNLVEYTAVIVNPKYLDGTNGWTVEASNGVQQIESKASHQYGVLEGWGTSATAAALNVYQDVTGLPEGVYQVFVRGLFRMAGTATDAKTTTYEYCEENGLLDLLTTAQKTDVAPREERGVFYGNDWVQPASRWIIIPNDDEVALGDSENGELRITQDMGSFYEFTVPGKNISYFYPDTRQAMINRSEFKAPQGDPSRSLYQNTFYVVVGPDKTLRLGAKNLNPQANDWFPFTDWKIYYMGNGSDVQDLKDKYNDFVNSVEGIAAPVVVKTEIFTIDGRRVSNLQKGLNIIRTTEFGGKVTVRKVLVK